VVNLGLRWMYLRENVPRPSLTPFLFRVILINVSGTPGACCVFLFATET
jgi:hypothetical protein